MNPEFYDYILKKLFKAGALDVYYSSIHMKKNRPAVKLSILSEDEALEQIVDILLKETTTLGVRIIDNIKRFCLEREVKEIETPWGKAKVKLAYKDGEIVNMAPEYDDCQQLAAKNDIPLKRIYQWIEKNI